MTKQEKIVCAATRFIYLTCEEIVLMLNYESKQFDYWYYKEGLTGFENGFITNKNRFVDPVEATEIAYRGRQLSRTLQKGHELKPEDLY